MAAAYPVVRTSVDPHLLKCLQLRLLFISSKNTSFDQFLITQVAMFIYGYKQTIKH